MSKGADYFLRKLWEIKGAPKLLKDTISAALAVTTAGKVSDERIKTRLEVCGSCPKVAILPNNQLACSVCGCTITDRHLLLNLALYEEDTSKIPLWGCKWKEPDGTIASRWQKEGV